MVPLEVAGGGLRPHVAVGVKGVGVRAFADLDLLQAIVGRLYGELAGEAAGAVGMFQAQHVAHRVIDIALGIGTGLGEISTPWLISPRLSVGRLIAFTASGGKQAVDGVIVEAAVEG